MKNQHKINRRTFLKFVGGAAVIAGGGFLAQRFDVLGRAAKRLDRIANPRKIEAEFIRQIITRDPSVSRTIMWQSEAAESAAAVEWREVDAQEVQRAAASNEDFTDDGRTAVLHVAGIEGLTPGRRYEYRRGGERVASFDDAGGARWLQGADLPRFAVERLFSLARRRARSMAAQPRCGLLRQHGRSRR